MTRFILGTILAIPFNAAAMLIFWLALKYFGYQWSWRLYCSAFAVYLILAFGDAARLELMKQVLGR